jgi:hypothetical protein
LNQTPFLPLLPGWPDWANFRLLGDCLPRVVFC